MPTQDLEKRRATGRHFRARHRLEIINKRRAARGLSPVSIEPLFGQRLGSVQPCMRPSTHDLNWAAGFLEGEGTFFYANGSYHVAAGQDERECLDRLSRCFGGRVVYLRRKRFGKPMAYCWQTYGARARGIMLTLFLLLSVRRRQQIVKAFRSDPRWQQAPLWSIGTTPAMWQKIQEAAAEG